MARDRPLLAPERLEQAAFGLRPTEREVLLLAAREGLSNQEIAVRLGISREEAEAILADALVELARALDRQQPPWWRFW